MDVGSCPWCTTALVSIGWVVMDLSSKSSAIMNDCSKRNYNYDQDNKCAANSTHAGSFNWLTVAWVLWYIEIIVLMSLVWYGLLRLSYKQ